MYIMISRTLKFPSTFYVIATTSPGFSTRLSPLSMQSRRFHSSENLEGRFFSPRFCKRINIYFTRSSCTRRSLNFRRRMQIMKRIIEGAFVGGYFRFTCGCGLGVGFWIDFIIKGMLAGLLMFQFIFVLGAFRRILLGIACTVRR